MREHNQRVPEVDFFERAELLPLREAYAAGLFATILAEERAVTVRLQKDKFPDYDFRIEDRVLSFELVEADRPGRRRGEEYKEAARGKAEHLPPKDRRVRSSSRGESGGQASGTSLPLTLSFTSTFGC